MLERDDKLVCLPSHGENRGSSPLGSASDFSELRQFRLCPVCCVSNFSPMDRVAGHDTRALQAWLGHKNIQHTVRYTELSPHRFKDFWR